MTKNKFVTLFGGLLFLALLSLPVSQSKALIAFQCPDGSTPRTGICPPTNPTISCANVRCSANTRCIETTSGPQCVALQPQQPTCPKWSTYNQYTGRCEYQQPAINYGQNYWPQTYQNPNYWYQNQRYYNRGYRQPRPYRYRYNNYYRQNYYHQQPYQYQYRYYQNW